MGSGCHGSSWPPSAFSPGGEVMVMGTKQGHDWGIIIYYAAAVAGWLQRRSTPKLVPACRQEAGQRQQEGEAKGSGGPQQLEAGSCQACRRLGGTRAARRRGRLTAEARQDLHGGYMRQSSAQLLNRNLQRLRFTGDRARAACSRVLAWLRPPLPGLPGLSHPSPPGLLQKLI